MQRHSSKPTRGVAYYVTRQAILNEMGYKGDGITPMNVEMAIMSCKGHTYAAIAKHFGTTPARVADHLNRLERNLRRDEFRRSRADH